MRLRSRIGLRDSKILPAAAALLLALLLAATTLSTTYRTDYSIEAQPAFDALRHGHVGAFLDLSPSYAGSLVLRAPLALMPGLWDGGSLAVFRAVSAPAVLALALLALFLWDRATRNATRRAGWIALLLVVSNPLAYMALRTGHAEEILVAAACVAAALAAARARPALAGVLLGAGIAAKPWAVVAIAPLLMVLQTGRLRFLAAAGGAAAAVFAPILLHGGGGARATAAVARSTGTTANPWQIWWFLGAHAGPVQRTFGRVFDDYRTEPSWVAQLSHLLVVGVTAAICAARHRALRGRPREDVLLLLAAVFFMRCLLDTWNHHYYALPAALALGTWEVLSLRRAPFAAWTLTLLTFVTVVLLPGLARADTQAAIYLAWALPFLAALTTAAFAPGLWAASLKRVLRRPDSAELAPGHVANGFRADDPDEVLLAYR